TKSEVKFKDERTIFKTVFDTIHEAIKGELKESFTNFFNKKDVNIYHSQKSIGETIKPEKEEVQIPIDLNNNNKIHISGNNIDSSINNLINNNSELTKSENIDKENTLKI